MMHTFELDAADRLRSEMVATEPHGSSSLIKFLERIQRPCGFFTLRSSGIPAYVELEGEVFVRIEAATNTDIGADIRRALQRLPSQNPWNLTNDLSRLKGLARYAEVKGMFSEEEINKIWVGFST